MQSIEGVERLLSMRARKRVGLFNQFGTSLAGSSCYGTEDIYFIRTGFGRAIFGHCVYADAFLLSGIWVRQRVNGKIETFRLPYSISKSTDDAEVLANRAKFKLAVAAAKAMTDEQKKEYNRRASGKHMSGYNLFIKEYMYG